MKKKPFIRTFVLLCRAAPIRVSAVIVLTVIAGILPSLRVFISIKLVNLIADFLQNTHKEPFDTIFKWVSIWAVIAVVSEVAVKLQNALMVIINEKFSAAIMTGISEKLSAVIDISFFENKENLIKVDMVREQIQVRPQNYVFNIIQNFQRIIGLTSMLAVLFSADYLLPVLMFCSTVPVFFISKTGGKKQWGETEKLQTEKLKLATYIKHGLEGEKAKDNFLFGFTKNFKTVYRNIRDGYLKKIIKITHKALFLQLLASLVSALITAGMFFLMIFIVIKKRMAVGTVAGYVQAFMYSQYEIQDLAMYGRWYFTIMGYFKNFFDIIDWHCPSDKTEIQNSKKIVLNEKIESIELKNVYFGYRQEGVPTANNTEYYVIKNLSLFIDKNNTYAVVGKNGSGKTTLIKLLAAFYTPQKGRIIINGKYNLYDIDITSYREKLSVLFQDFALYPGYSINENIFVRPEHSKEDEKEKAGKIQCLGAEFEQKLKNNYSAVLGIQYGGTELSGGQKQRLAALRSFIKKSDVIFFDEPTSAIDPIAENEFMNSILTQTKDKISLIVTHRMGNVQFCGSIIVIDEGTVKEKGDFKSLMAQNGLFAKLYNSQRKNFIEENTD